MNNFLRAIKCALSGILGLSIIIISIPNCLAASTFENVALPPAFFATIKLILCLVKSNLSLLVVNGPREISIM